MGDIQRKHACASATLILSKEKWCLEIFRTHHHERASRPVLRFEPLVSVSVNAPYLLASGEHLPEHRIHNCGIAIKGERWHLRAQVYQPTWLSRIPRGNTTYGLHVRHDVLLQY
jgi:hypothetical protein